MWDGRGATTAGLDAADEQATAGLELGIDRQHPSRFPNRIVECHRLSVASRRLSGLSSPKPQAALREEERLMIALTGLTPEADCVVSHSLPTPACRQCRLAQPKGTRCHRPGLLSSPWPFSDRLAVQVLRSCRALARSLLPLFRGPRSDRLSEHIAWNCQSRRQRARCQASRAVWLLAGWLAGRLPAVPKARICLCTYVRVYT